MREWTTDFLASLESTPNVSEACRVALITRKTAYDLRKSDPEFRQAWDDALATSVDDLVGECYKRAKAGSDTLAIFLLKSHRREVYGDKVQTDLTTDGKPLAVQIYIPSNGRDDRSKDDPAQLDPPRDLPQLGG
ncbi:hypothetical protein [Singulisphaera sp. PoT]|uniref:hypothetical protein n=1 Tax=Singulisphaera sp. PoT TaxID=3411797 RepID=UPI003BF5BD6E